MRLETIILINRAPFKKIQLQLENENVFILSGINDLPYFGEIRRVI